MTSSPQQNRSGVKKDKSLWSMAFNGVTDADQLFDLVVWGAYCRGSFNGKIPVEEARDIFKKIKKLLK